MKKFTLIEMLIVIAIISILVSILLPSLNKAREKAKLAVCLSQLSQLSKAAVSYTMRNKGLFPLEVRSGFTIRHPNKFRGDMLAKMNLSTDPYDKDLDLKVMQCPSRPKFSFHKVSHHGALKDGTGIDYWTSYAYWASVYDKSYSDVTMQQDIIKELAPRRITSVQSDAFLFTDQVRRDQWFGEIANHGTFWKSTIQYSKPDGSAFRKHYGSSFVNRQYDLRHNGYTLDWWVYQE